MPQWSTILIDVMSRDSVCSQGKAVSYYWRMCPNGGHIELTAEKVVEILKTNGYILNGHLEADCVGQIEAYLELAEAGHLKPSDHVKRVRRAPEIHMFEIRWDHIGTTKQDKVSGMYEESRAMVRLYYVEQGEPWVVGLHVHEKTLGSNDNETNRLQNQEMDKARTCFEAGADSWWGVAELAP